MDWNPKHRRSGVSEACLDKAQRWASSRHSAANCRNALAQRDGAIQSYSGLFKVKNPGPVAGAFGKAPLFGFA
jgi:hypothetical protein